MNVLPSFGSEPSYWPEVHSTLPEWRMGAISQVSGKQDTGLPWEAQGQDGDAPVLKTLFHAYLNFSLQVSATIHVHVSAWTHMHICPYALTIHTCECIWAYMHVYVWMWRSDSWYLPLSLGILSFETGPLSGPGAHWFDWDICLSSFSVAMAKHPWQKQLIKKLFNLGLMVPNVSIYDYHGREHANRQADRQSWS